MNPQTFLANFGYVANAPNGVKSLRQLVMASALAGKFSAPNDDLPSDIETLLEEARSLHFRSAGKREKPLLFAAPLIQEFEIPAGWKWVRVGQICDLQTGATPSTQRPEYWGGEIPWLASGDVNLREIFECEGRITEEGLANSNCKILPRNSVLIALNGQGKTRATVALLRIPAACNQSLVAMIPFDVRIITPEYLFLSLRYRYYEIRDITGQDQRRGLNMSLVSDLSVPLAPLAEQNRIVAKVDDLMALCDQLETQQQERERRFPVLSRTCHARFTEAPTPANLNRIFDETGSVSPEDLRRTILTLAVQGLLSPQNPTDEPATLLIERIRDTNGKSTNRRVSNRRDLVIQEPFPLPPGWAWGRFPDLGLFGRGKSRHRPRNDTRLFTNGTYRLVQTGDVARAHGTILTHTGLYNEIGLAQSKLWPEGTLCITIAANIADSGILGFDACIPDSVVGFVPSESLPTVRYFEYFMRTAKEAISKFAPATAQKNINLGILEQVQIPIPPANEQRRIVAKVDELMALVDQLEAQQLERAKLAEAFAKASVASFTGTTQLERPEKMKAPKTELVSRVTLSKKPKSDVKAPLAQLLIQNKRTLPAKALWQQSGLTIDAFYQQLKTEIAQGWIALPAEAEMKVLEEA